MYITLTRLTGRKAIKLIFASIAGHACEICLTGTSKSTITGNTIGTIASTIAGYINKSALKYT